MRTAILKLGDLHAIQQYKDVLSAVIMDSLVLFVKPWKLSNCVHRFVDPMASKLDEGTFTIPTFKLDLGHLQIILFTAYISQTYH